MECMKIGPQTPKFCPILTNTEAAIPLLIPVSYFLFFIVAHQILRMFPWASDSQINNDYEKLLKNDEKPLEKSGAVCQDRKSRK